MGLARQSGWQQGSARQQSSMCWPQVPGLPVWRQPLLVLVLRLSVPPVFSLLAFWLRLVLPLAWLQVWLLPFSLQAWPQVLQPVWRRLLPEAWQQLSQRVWPRRF